MSEIEPVTSTRVDRDDAAGNGDGRGPYRLLAVAAEGLSNEAIPPEIARRLDRGGAEVVVIAPALADSRLKHALGDVDEGISRARERLERSLRALRERGIEARGQVADADPATAVDDALGSFPADEILLVTRSDEEARALEKGLFERAARKFDQPITHVAYPAADGGDGVEVERAAAGDEREQPGEVGGGRRNMPPLSLRDIGGMLIAVLGTFALILLAATCTGSDVAGASADQGSADDGCVVRYLLAGGVALINVAHIVGLMLFQAQRYRGVFARSFAWMSLIGTPAAIIISLLVH